MMPRKENLAELKFRPLKRQMQKLFREMQFDVQNGISPTVSQAAEFIRQVEIMVSYPGFGDKYYQSFLDAAQKLGGLTPQTPASAWQQHLNDIAAQRRRCHESLAANKHRKQYD